MTTICPICDKDWDYHSEAETNSCGRKLCEKVTDYVTNIAEQINELWEK